MKPPTRRVRTRRALPHFGCRQSGLPPVTCCRSRPWPGADPPEPHSEDHPHHLLETEFFPSAERAHPLQTLTRCNFHDRKMEPLCYDSAMKLRSVSRGSERTKLPDSRSERNLAVAILRQAWHEAVMDLRSVKETSRNDYRLLKKKAIEWISSDNDGFPYWCKLADVDHQAVRQKLSDTLQRQRMFRASESY